MDWFRVYSSIKDDPKILQFSPENRWFYVAILCVSSEQEDRGTLPSTDLLAIALRIRKSKVRSLLAEFVKAGLIDENATTKALTIHGWDKRQRKADDVNSRVKRHRDAVVKQAYSVTRNVTETLPHACATDTDTDTDTDPPLNAPPPGGASRDDEKQSSPLASTPEEIVRLEAIASAVFDPLCLTDIWLPRIRTFAAMYPAEWVEEVIPLVAAKARTNKFLRESFAVAILRDWQRAGGPENERASPVVGPAHPKPMTDHQRKMADYRKRREELADLRPDQADEEDDDRADIPQVG